MPQRIAPFVEMILGFLTITSTFLFADFVIDLVVGIVVYFVSRWLYRAYGVELYNKWFKK